MTSPRDGRIALTGKKLRCISGMITEIIPANDFFKTIIIQRDDKSKEKHLAFTAQIPEDELVGILNTRCFFQMFDNYDQWVVFDYIKDNPL